MLFFAFASTVLVVTNRQNIIYTLSISSSDFLAIFSLLYLTHNTCLVNASELYHHQFVIMLNVDIFSFIVDSTSVFGVSTESMQLSFDARGNSVPTILLLMQRHLYAQGGLQVFELKHTRNLLYDLLFNFHRLEIELLNVYI
jgi:hypothetical protein